MPIGLLDGGHSLAVAYKGVVLFFRGQTGQRKVRRDERTLSVPVTSVTGM